MVDTNVGTKDGASSGTKVGTSVGTRGLDSRPVTAYEKRRQIYT